MASYGDIIVLPLLAERIAGFLASPLSVAKLLSINSDIYNQHLDLVHDMWAHIRRAAELRADMRRARQPRLHPEPRGVTELRLHFYGIQDAMRQ